MKAMPLSFEEFQGKGLLLNFSSSSSSSAASSSSLSSSCSDSLGFQQKWYKENCYVGTEPTSVLDTRRSPISSTMSSSLGGSNGGGAGGGGGSTDTTGVGAGCGGISGNQAAASQQAGLYMGSSGLTEKCGMEDWESVLSESANQEPSILRLIMGDVEDPSVGLNKFLQSGSGADFNGGFGGVDQGLSFQQQQQTSGGNLVSSIDNSSLAMMSCGSEFSLQSIYQHSNSNASWLGSIQNQNPLFSTSGGNSLLPVSLPSGVLNQQQQQTLKSLDTKPQIFNPQGIVNQNQAHFAQNPALFLPFSYTQMQEHGLVVPPPPKRLNSGGVVPNYQVPKVPSLDQDVLLRRQQQQQQQYQLHMVPNHLQQRPTTVALPKQKMMSPADDEFAGHQNIIDEIFKASELIESGNLEIAQGILARLNHQLSPVGKAFYRAAFYFKEALQLLVHLNNSPATSPFSLIFKIGAYKSFSEVSPILHFANFTCNQALLESLEGFDRIHIIDFDIGYGGQWASFMQELALRNEGAPALKITAFASSSTNDQLELGFTQENLKHFASEINMPFEIEIVSLESLNSATWPLPIHTTDCEAIAVNLPIGSFSNFPLSLNVVLQFVKKLSPKIVVSLDRGCDRVDAPFPHQMIHALQSYSSLLESLDAVNTHLDALQKIERFLLQPSIERIVLGRHRSHERTPPWRSLFLTSGFIPLTFSNFTECQAECLVQRTPVRGFHVEKKHSSLVLCWQRKDLISASAWRC